MKVQLNQDDAKIAIAKYLKDVYGLKAYSFQLVFGNIYSSDFVTWDESISTPPEDENEENNASD